MVEQSYMVNTKCPVCGATLVCTKHGVSSTGKPWFFVRCPEVNRHIRGFVSNVNAWSRFEVCPVCRGELDVKEKVDEHGNQSLYIHCPNKCHTRLFSKARSFPFLEKARSMNTL